MIGNFVGRPLDEVVYMLGSVIALVSSLGMQYIQNPKYRRAYSLTFGLLIHVYVFGRTSIVSISTALFIYLLMSLFRGDR